MKIIRTAYKLGYVILMPTDEEDLWHLYNLIQKGDCVQMRTLRKVTKTNSIGLKDVQKKKLVLTLSIVNIDYFAEGDYLTISLKGQNIVQNDHLQIGQYHTFVIQLNEKIKIIKEHWTGYEIGLIKEISQQAADCQVAAIVMDEGIANICYIKNSMTLRKMKIQKNVSKKGAGEDIHTKSLGKFFDECYKGLKTLDYSRLKCVIVASPGFVNEQFMKYVKEASNNEADKAFRKQLEKFVLVKTSTGWISSLTQALADPQVAKHLQNTKALNEVRALKQFQTTMKTAFDKIAYGQRDVKKCNELGAIHTLLISDKLFRTKDLHRRKYFNWLVENVKQRGGKVHIFSSLHPSGEKLNSYTGIAAILRFEVDLQEQQEDAEKEESEDEKEERVNETLLKRIREEQGEKGEEEDFQM